jgi:hypothetical protein
MYNAYFLEIFLRNISEIAMIDRTGRSTVKTVATAAFQPLVLVL